MTTRVLASRPTALYKDHILIYLLYMSNACVALELLPKVITLTPAAFVVRRRLALVELGHLLC